MSTESVVLERQAGTRLDPDQTGRRVFPSSPACLVAGETSCSGLMLESRQRKGKKNDHNQWDPFCFSGNLLLAPDHTQARTEEQENWTGAWLCLCVWLPLSVWDWLYLRQGSFCFKPESSSGAEAGPVIGLLRPCLAWEKSPWPGSAKLTFVFSRGEDGLADENSD